MPWARELLGMVLGPVSIVSTASTAALALLLAATHASGGEAWVSLGRANVRLLPSATSPIIGLLERGDRVEVDGAEPQDGWTLLRPFGAVRSAFLVLGEPSSELQPVDYVYGRVITPFATVRAQPEPDARVVSRQVRRHILAFKKTPGPEGAWLERPDGTFVAREEVKLLVGSSL